MIKAQVSIKNNKYTGFTCTGHAEFDDKGKDIVCASVSVLVINTANAIEKLSDCDFSSNDKNGKIEYIFNSEPDEKAVVLMDALVIGLKEIQKVYGKNYLSFVIK